MFIPLNALDKKYKPMIINWLCSKVSKSFKKKYEHSFKDHWINWSIYDDRISVSLDFTVEAQKELFDKLPDENKGCLQRGTRKLVNKQVLYFSFEPEIHVQFPKIIKHKLLETVKHKDSDGDIFYEYYWEVFLEDNTSIQHRNQKPEMDLTETSWTYIWHLQERAFRQFLDNNYRIPPSYEEKEVFELLTKVTLENIQPEGIASWFRENRK